MKGWSRSRSGVSAVVVEWEVEPLDIRLSMLEMSSKCEEEKENASMRNLRMC